MRTETERVTELELPQVRAKLRQPPAPRRGAKGKGKEPRLLVLGGRYQDEKWLAAAAQGRDVWAVDFGMEACRGADLKPSRVGGDMDSISQGGRFWMIRDKIPETRYPAEKDETDFQLALALAGGDVVVTGCWGRRFDHAFSNIFSALLAPQLGARILCFADEREVLFPLVGPGELGLTFVQEPLAVSLLPLTGEVRGVTARGVKWPLSGAELRQDNPYSISNELEPGAADKVDGADVYVSLDEGALGIYAVFNVDGMF